MGDERTGSPPRFLVFLAGYASPYSESKYGGYGQMLVDLLREPGEVWDIVPVVDGVFPPQSQLETYEGFVITGSRYDAHGSEEWILKLCAVLRHLHLQRKKVLGICFGHQVLSRALGGKTGRTPVGWELGAREIHINCEVLSQRLYGDVPPVLRVIESHQDQVLEVPADAQLLGYSRRTPIEMFSVGEHILGIQGHPEFDEDVILDLIDTRLQLNLITEEEARDAKASLLANPPDNGIWQRFLKGFLRNRHS